MSGAPVAPAGSAAADPLDAMLSRVEQRLAALGEALRAGDGAAVERHAGDLHAALAQAVQTFSRAARAGDVPAPLRRRLAAASGRVAAQRETLARATAHLDRAIDVLLPRDGSPSAALYGAHGGPARPAGSGLVQA